MLCVEYRLYHLEVEEEGVKDDPLPGVEEVSSARDQ